MKRIIECLIVALMFLGSFAFADWDGSSSEPKNTKEIDGKIFYEISNPEELAWFAEQVNSGKTTINAVLANDIKFMDDTSKTSSKDCTPIGVYSMAMFNGIFDGAEHTIYGLSNWLGVFGYTDTDAIVKNLKLSKSSVIQPGYDAGGGIVFLNKGLIFNCINYGSIKVRKYNGFSTVVGGIVGINRGGTVENCINEGEFKAYSSHYGDTIFFDVGGIVGKNDSGIVLNCENRGKITSFLNLGVIGGIVGKNIGTVSNCKNIAEKIEGDGVRAGGIVGENSLGSSIENSTNDGTVLSFMGKDYKRESEYAGGIASHNLGSISRCVNRGRIGGGYSGGIVGKNDVVGSISFCENSGNIGEMMNSRSSGGVAGFNLGSISFCENSGSVYGITKSSLATVYSIGGIAGRNEGGVSRCKNKGSIYCKEKDVECLAGGIVGSSYGNSIISVCINEGAIQASSTLLSDYSAIGGIAGTSQGDSILNCINRGEISGGSYSISSSGGLVGKSYKGSLLCNSYNAGLGINDAAHGIVAKVENGEVINCFFDHQVFLSSKRGEYDKTMATSEMQTDAFAWSLNTTEGTRQNSEIWSRDRAGYPIFADTVYRPIYKVIFKDGSDTDERYTNYKGFVDFPKNKGVDGLVFTGWYTQNGSKVNEASAFVKDQTVYAKYINPFSTYFTILFLNADSSLLDQQYVKYGMKPVYNGVPTKKSTDKYSYTFAGWHTEIVAATENFAYYAVFDSTRIIPQAVPITVSSPAWSVTASGRNFQIHAAPVGKPYALFDLQGKVLAKGRVESPEMTISVPRAGSYIVRIGNHSVRMNAK